MYEVFERLFIGSISDCRSGGAEWTIVHACKSPCHKKAVGYHSSLSPSHPHYLFLEKKNDLYLNILDSTKPLFVPPLFTIFLRFSEKQWYEGKKILIHCELGESRAPSLALIFLAKSVEVINSFSFGNAKNDFQKLYPFYRPGLGLQIYLENNWELLSSI